MDKLHSVKRSGQRRGRTTGRLRLLVGQCVSEGRYPAKETVRGSQAEPVRRREAV